MNSVTLELLGGPLDGEVVAFQLLGSVGIGVGISVEACSGLAPYPDPTKWGPESYTAGHYVIAKQVSEEYYEAKWSPAA